MSLEPIAFWALAAVLVASALAVVLTKNLFHSVLYLALALTGTAGIFLPLEAEFLAAVQLLLYAGGLITIAVFAIVVTERLVGTRLSQTSRHLFNGDQVDIRYRARGTPRHLPASVQTTVLRVGREALFNAIKHGSPKSIDVLVTYQARHLVLDVADDGRGADPQALDEASSLGHFGVAGMRERAERSGGTLSIMTSPGKGLTVHLTVPAEPID